MHSSGVDTSNHLNLGRISEHSIAAAITRQESSRALIFTSVPVFATSQDLYHICEESGFIPSVLSVDWARQHRSNKGI